VDRKAICQYHLDFPSARQEDIAARYGVERSTISKILKQKEKWMNVPEAESLRVAKHRHGLPYYVSIGVF
jgi:DNA-binding LacI/PurR family transcriptional regulator